MNIASAISYYIDGLISLDELQAVLAQHKLLAYEVVRADGTAKLHII